MNDQFSYLLGSSSNPDPIAVTGNSAPINAYGLSTGQITATVTDLTPAAAVFTANATTDIMTAANNGFVLGQVVQLSNLGGALPTGLSTSTNYYVIPLNGDTFKLATSYNNAIAGTAIDITTNGTGVQTATPTALAGGTGTLQSAQRDQNGAVIASTWKDVPDTSQTISGLGTFNFPIFNMDFPAYRLKISGNTAGVLGLVVTFSGKGA